MWPFDKDKQEKGGTMNASDPSLQAPVQDVPLADSGTGSDVVSPQGGQPADAPITESRLQQYLDGFGERLSERMYQIIGGQQVAPVAPEPAPLPPIVDVDEDEWAEALAAGDKDKIKKLDKIRRSADQERHRREIESLREQGLGAIAAQNELQATNMPHYKRFEKQIKAAVATLGVDAKANPQVWKMAHDLVVGQNAEVLMREEREKWARDGSQGKTADVSAQSGRAQTTQPTPRVEEVVGADGVRALQDAKIDPNSFALRAARAFGMENVTNITDYMTHHERREAEAAKGGKK